MSWDLIVSLPDLCLLILIFDLRHNKVVLFFIGLVFAQRISTNANLHDQFNPLYLAIKRFCKKLDFGDFKAHN